MATIGNDILQAKKLLLEGELVAIPTETVYGLAANALNPEAVTQIFVVKERPSFDPLIVHVASIDQAQQFITAVPEKAIQLARHFWPGPLTLVLPKQSIIPDIVTSGLSTVGIRCPDHDLTRQLLSELPFPLAAPSANPFGYVSPTTAEHVNNQLGHKIKYILDGGPCRIGLESTIVGFENDQAVIYRRGGVSEEEIAKVIGEVSYRLASSNPVAPGQLDSHYAPNKKFYLGDINELKKEFTGKKVGVLRFMGNSDSSDNYKLILSQSGNLEEAARNLFAALRQFDQMEIEVILAEPVPDSGIGKAINDRLRRAATK
ncbi:MAG TPA: L-threonylcarbamoyladenylate synthase [Cyclobacteriaceae bacterium]|nr:L-threonylcarbamoyladenylate synthase [Cyclobacteriaceae bacterium]